MFMIHTPQTIELYGLKAEDGSPGESAGSITFQHETEDVSKCQMVVRIEDRVYTCTFGTRGPIVETGYEDDATRKAAEEAQKRAAADLEKQRDADRHHAAEANAHELRTSDDTTANDLSNDAPGPLAPPPFHEAPQRDPFADLRPLETHPEPQHGG